MSLAYHVRALRTPGAPVRHVTQPAVRGLCRYNHTISRGRALLSKDEDAITSGLPGTFGGIVSFTSNERIQAMILLETSLSLRLSKIIS